MASLVLRPPVLALPHFAAMSLSAAATAELRALSPATRAELASLSASPSAAAAALARALAPPPSPDDAAPADLRDEGCMDDEEACEALDTGTAAASQPDDAALAAAAALREAAAKAATEGDWSAAVAALTSAIAAPSATLLSRRAEALLALRRPVAALRDADAALLLNADSARALRAQGLAHRARGEWAAAAASLGAAQRVDFDAATDPVLRLCVDKAAIVRKRRVDAEHASAAEAAARAARAAEAAKAAKSSAARAGVVRSVHSPSEFDALLAEGFPVVVDFTAAWCGPCKMMAPVFEELAKSNHSVTFAKVDVDELASVAASAGVTAMPTFVRYSKAGARAGELRGADPAGLRRLVADANAGRV